MCTHSGKSPDTSPIFADILDRVHEDRAEIVPFRYVGQVAASVADRSVALAGWRVQITLIARNCPDPLVRVAAAAALRHPDEASLRQLINLTEGTPHAHALYHALAELMTSHLDTIFGDS